MLYHESCKLFIRPKYPMPEFIPAYFTNDYGCTKDLNAIIEIRALWKYVMQEALHNYSDMYSQLKLPVTKDLKQICQKHNEVFAVYDKREKKWLVESNEPSYKHCYNGEDFEEFEEAKAKATGNRLLLVGKYTSLMQEPNLFRETRTASTLYATFRMPRLELIVGVPGCGKTTFIIRYHRLGSLVLTSCTEGAADIRKRMAILSKSESKKFRDSYRTIDSYLLHSRRRYNEVWIDEALMEHPGKLFLVCLFSRCQTMYMLGDPNQLGYINRVNSIELLYDKSSLFFKPTQTLNTSYRCPVDVMTILSPKYNEGAYSASSILRSMVSKPYISLEDVPKAAETKYLVFKQAEKKQMKSAGYDVSTIHEFQGKQAKHVVIVRMSNYLREPLYESAAHILVGMSRHTHSLVYYTPVTDHLKRLIATRLTEEELLKHQKLANPLKSATWRQTVIQEEPARRNIVVPPRSATPTISQADPTRRNIVVPPRSAAPTISQADPTRRNIVVPPRSAAPTISQADPTRRNIVVPPRSAASTIRQADPTRPDTSIIITVKSWFASSATSAWRFIKRCTKCSESETVLNDSIRLTVFIFITYFVRDRDRRT